MALRVGMIGCGGIARAHWKGWAELEGRAKIVALCDVSEENRAWFKQHVPDAEEYADFETMIADEKLDAIDICLPHHLHHPCIMAAIQAGLHWLCEKPLCMSLAEADDIEAAMRKTDLVAMSAHNQAFFPALLEAKRIIEDGQLGEIYTILSEECFILGLPRPGALPGSEIFNPVAAGTWRADKAKMGGGELIDTGYHPTYRLLLLARGEPTHVAAITGTYRNKHMQAEDTATVLVRFDDGVTGLVCTSWAMPTPAGHHAFHVTGQHGELFGSAHELFWKPARFGEPARLTFDPVDGFVAEVTHFVDCIEQHKRPLQNHEDGIRVLRVILGSYDFVAGDKGRI